MNKAEGAITGMREVEAADMKRMKIMMKTMMKITTKRTMTKNMTEEVVVAEVVTAAARPVVHAEVLVV